MLSSASVGPSRRLMLSALAALPILPGILGTTAAQAQTAPLSSWNDGPAKQAILDFVRVTTDRASPSFVPPEGRIATFDQDGTLWVEHPMYTQVVYCLERVPAVVKAKPELAKAVPYGPAQGLPNTRVGTFTQALYDEARQDWIVISMKKDWKRIFAFE